MKKILIIIFASLILLPSTLVLAEGSNKTCQEIQADCQKNPENTDCKMICTDLAEGLPESALSSGMECTSKDDSTGICKTILTKSGTQGIQAFIEFIYKIAAIVIGLAAVIMIVFAGFQMSYSGGAKDVGGAKETIMNAIFAIILILLSGLILRFVNPSFFT